MTARASRGNALVASLLALGLGLYVLLHYAEPELSVTWSYAHLHRRAFLLWLGAALIVVLPISAHLLWRHPAAQRPLGRITRGQAAGGLLLLFAGTLALSLWFPQQPHAVDSVEFLLSTSQPGFRYPARWYLSIRVYRLLATMLVPPLEPEVFARGVNALLGAVALTALAGCARLLSRTRGEAAALTLLVWTSFGVLQISVGYLDIYPVPMAMTALYLWLALRVLVGRTHIVWPLLIVGLGPFFYIGAVLLAPSMVLLAYHVARRPGGLRRLLVSGLITLAAMAAATIPGHGRPLAWHAWYVEAAEAASCSWGLAPDSCLLPLDYMLGRTHLNEMLHLLLLVDGVGLLLFVVCTIPELARHWRNEWRKDWRRIDLRVLVLGSIAAGHFAFLLMLDPLFGQYSDWDAYTYPAVAVTLLGGWGFVQWGRRRPRAFDLLLGLALAAASVHLLARLNAMHLDYHRHVVETPCHVNCGPPGSYYESCRGCTWDGLLLLCECRTRDGGWRRAGTIRKCPRGFRNQDGFLRCE